jgi:prephenate dehydrogenase
MKIEIIGGGIFGKFLKELLTPHAEIHRGADDVILAVPLQAYEQVASQNAGKHLVNVCSVQRDSNAICLRHTENVTGIHPLFGPRSLESNKVSVLTQRCSRTELITELFQKVGVEICTTLPDGRIIDGELHDRMMAATHFAGMHIAENLKDIVDAAAWVPDKFVPPSFQRIRDFVVQCQDFSPETASSIKANPFGLNK